MPRRPRTTTAIQADIDALLKEKARAVARDAAVAKKARDARYVVIGKLAEKAGLLVEDDGVITTVLELGLKAWWAQQREEKA